MAKKRGTSLMDVFYIFFRFQVRVCDPCFDLYGPKEEAGARPPAQQQKKKTEGDLPAEYLASALSKQVCTLIIYEKN